MTNSPVNLSAFNRSNFDRGKPFWVEALWRIVSALVFQSSWVPFYGLKRTILRLFGANVGEGVIIKPRVTLTLPWKVSIGNHSWIGEDVWLDSLNQIQIQENVCISQGAYLCTGNHDYRSKLFDLVTKPIIIKSGAWIAAQAVVAPGVIVEEGAILTLGSVAVGKLKANTIYQGNPAAESGKR